jgi:hypothetical protein
MLLLNAAYCSYANTDMGKLSKFTGTRAIILSFMQNIMSGRRAAGDEDPFLSNFGGALGLSLMQDFSSTAGKFPENPLEDQLKSIVKNTPKLILKALAEITDPCVMTGKAINQAIIMIIETTLKVAEDIEKAAFDAIKTVVDFNKALVDGLYMVIKQVESSLGPLEQQIKMLPSVNAEQQFLKKQKEEELDDLKQDLADKKAVLKDALTLLYGKYVKETEAEFSKDDNPDLYEKDWIMPPETKIYMAPKLNPATTKTDEVGVVPSDGDAAQRKAWPDFENQIFHKMASADLNFKVAVRKTRNSMKAVDPYMLPIICFLLFPSTVPYGGGFIGWAPPPFGIGFGPPITPLGFIHLVMVSLGFADDYEKWLKGEIDIIETEAGLSEEGEEC